MATQGIGVTSGIDESMAGSFATQSLSELRKVAFPVNFLTCKRKKIIQHDIKGESKILMLRSVVNLLKDKGPQRVTRSRIKDGLVWPEVNGPLRA